MIFPVLFSLFLAVSILYFTLTGKEAWPFSCYPMFSSHPKNITDVLVFRLALETQSGAVVWWTPHYYGYQRNFGYEFKQICGVGRQNKALAEIQWRKLLKQTRSLIETESNLADFRALHIVRRTVDAKPEGGFEFLDQGILKISVDVLLTGKLTSVFLERTALSQYLHSGQEM